MQYFMNLSIGFSYLFFIAIERQTAKPPHVMPIAMIANTIALTLIAFSPLFPFVVRGLNCHGLTLNK